MKMTLGAAALIAATGLLSTSALAQTPPAFMQGLDFTYEGQIGGLHAWSRPGTEELWVMLPDGRHVMAGYLFNQHGRDIGSVILGIEPIDALESMGLEDPGGRASPDVDPWAPGNPDLGSLVDDIIPEAIGSASPHIATMDPQDRNRLIAELIAGMDAATSPEEFRTAILEWGERVAGEPGDPGRSSGAMVDVPGQDVSPEERDAAGVASSDMELLQEIRSDLFWFSVGHSDAPTVYMFYDPACPHCARSIRNLQPRIEAGKLQIRVILTPSIAATSLGYAAAMLTSDDPVGTFLENALSKARFGQSSVQPASAELVPEAFLTGMQENLDFLGRYGIQGVPFFAWMSGEGPRFLSGVPARDYAFGAVVDPYRGSD